MIFLVCGLSYVLLIYGLDGPIYFWHHNPREYTDSGF